MGILIQLLIVLAVLLVIWWVGIFTVTAVQRFSPDPMITKIAQVIIFIIAVIVLIQTLDSYLVWLRL